ncbi:hypothetical protein Ccar_09510 [Clostridium carboxidivorans P7]|uniref:YxaJ n=1 Tax=Clostridium carboxidivorans P7 TaxID=536227 RepID=C6Q1J7_9CLOT|nr:DUF5391 family protein [Clostridium carboxidivorans]AKN31073.1 hypothetical protein Ccar_09510 [Clostridium carboxidivorans P7]EET84636.1 YxaJ [Clostridium carboxidivorans P7]EFG88660.1 hypothetical protein CLCAR_1405 [Clostridium carboxidivorans P7]
MIKQKNKCKIILITLVSTALFCLLVGISSISPLANSGPNANKFNSIGMWSAIGIISLLYILPLIVYALGVDVMKFVIAAFLVVGMLADFSIIVLISNSLTKSSLYPLIGAICITSLIVNVVWFFVVFSLSSKRSQV